MNAPRGADLTDTEAGRISLIQGIPTLWGGSSLARGRRTGVPTYLVERYWPGVKVERLLEALGRGRRVMEQMGGEEAPLRHIGSILIPGEEVVLSVYEGPSAVAVGQLNERASIPVSRIVEAIAVTDNWLAR
jgi:hypothetical protein